MSPITNFPNAVFVNMNGMATTISSLRVAMPNIEEMGPWQETMFTAILNVSAFVIFACLSTFRLGPSSLALLVAAATFVAQHLEMQPLPALQFYPVAIEALFLAVLTPFTTDDIDDDKYYKSYGRNLATVFLWGLMATNRCHLGWAWPLVFGFFFCLLWPLSFIVEIGLPISKKPLSETAILSTIVISIIMAPFFQFGMDFSFWATWPLAVISLYWAFPKDAPIIWNIVGIALLTMMGIVVDITASPMRFQVFSLGVSAIILVKQAFLDVFRRQEPHTEKDCLPP